MNAAVDCARPREWLRVLSDAPGAGILDGRATAFLPAAVGLAWVVGLIVDGSFSRARRSAPYSASAHREDTSADLDLGPA